MLNQHDAIVEEFHNILNTELGLLRLSNDKVIGEMITTALGFNTIGIFSAEAMAFLGDKLSIDKDWHRLWGTVATNFTAVLTMKFGISSMEYAQWILKAVQVSYVETSHVPSFNLTETIQGRFLDLQDARGKPISLLAPADFSLICIMLFRLTLYSNVGIMSEVQQMHARSVKSESAERPRGRIPT